MATILAHITVKPGTAARFEEIARELYAPSHELETHLLRYEYWRGAQEDTYYTLLSFDSYDGFLEHQTSDHHEVAARQLGEVLASIRLEFLDPVQGASPLPPTNPSPPREDPSELWQAYATRMPAQVAGWWGALRGDEV